MLDLIVKQFLIIAYRLTFNKLSESDQNGLKKIPEPDRTESERI